MTFFSIFKSSIKMVKLSVQEAKKHIHLSEYTDYRLYLFDLFQWLKEKKRVYTYRDFATDLNFPGSNFIQLVINGKRNLSKESINKIIKSLGLKKLKSKYFKFLVCFNQETDVNKKAQYYHTLKQSARRLNYKLFGKDQYQCYSNWYNLVLLELINTVDFKEDIDWIYDVLETKVPKAKLQSSMKLLKKLGLIEECQGKLQVKDRVMSTGDEVHSMAVKKYYLDIIDQAKIALEKIESPQREYGAQTLSISLDSFEEIKEKIRRFRKEILQIAADSDDPSLVYQLNIQLFPLARC